MTSALKPKDLVLGTEYKILYQGRWERARLVVVHERLELRVPFDTTKTDWSFEFEWSFSQGKRRTTIRGEDVGMFVCLVPAAAPILPEDVGTLKLELAEAEHKVTALEKAIESQRLTILRQENEIESQKQKLVRQEEVIVAKDTVIGNLRKTISEMRDAIGCGFGQDAREVAKTLLSYKDKLAKSPGQTEYDYYKKTAMDVSDLVGRIRETMLSYSNFDQLVDDCRQAKSNSDRLKKLLALMKEGV